MTEDNQLDEVVRLLEEQNRYIARQNVMLELLCYRNGVSRDELPPRPPERFLPPSEDETKTRFQRERHR